MVAIFLRCGCVSSLDLALGCKCSCVTKVRACILDQDLCWPVMAGDNFGGFSGLPQLGRLHQCVKIRRCGKEQSTQTNGVVNVDKGWCNWLWTLFTWQSTQTYLDSVIHTTVQARFGPDEVRNRQTLVNLLHLPLSPIEWFSLECTWTAPLSVHKCFPLLDFPQVSRSCGLGSPAQECCQLQQLSGCLS